MGFCGLNPAGLLPRIARDHHEHTITIQLRTRLRGHHEMGIVHGIERASE